MRMIPITLMACLGLAGCVEDAEVAGPMAFAQDCAGCHGRDAMGAGDFGRQLIRQPPDLTTLAQRNGDYVMSTIDGYARGAHFSAAMPEFGAGDMGPTIVVENADGTGTPIPARLLALADYLETLQR